MKYYASPANPRTELSLLGSADASASFRTGLPLLISPFPPNGLCSRVHSPSALLEGIVVDLQPIPIRVLQVDLFHLVGPYLRRLGGLRPVAIFDVEIIQVFREDRHVRDAEGEVYIDVV